MKIIKALVYTSALLTLLPFLRPRGLAARAWIWMGKLLAGALAPVLGIVSGLGGVLGLMRRDWKLAGAGLAGAGLAAKYIGSLPTSQGEFAAAFGPDCTAPHRSDRNPPRRPAVG